MWRTVRLTTIGVLSVVILLDLGVGQRKPTFNSCVQAFKDLGLTDQQTLRFCIGQHISNEPISGE